LSLAGERPGPPVLVTRDELAAAVDRLAGELSATYADGVLLIAVLKGSVLFLADLVRRMTILPEVDFLAISRYAEGTGRVRLVKDLEADIAGRDVVLVEDVIDTGLTSTYILGQLTRREPRSLAVCTLLDKQVRRIVPIEIRFAGVVVDDQFVLGYGLDYGERYRNLNAIVAGDLGRLRDDPDAHVNELYAG
jgi:hypoxanthine phosphoribosyltransferase